MYVSFWKEELSPYFEVVAESDGTSGLERAKVYDADLIISDVLMPGCSGFELTRKLKNDFNTSHIPIILLTALNSQEKHLEGVEAGADAYITKPFSSSLLRAGYLTDRTARPLAGKVLKRSSCCTSGYLYNRP